MRSSHSQTAAAFPAGGIDLAHSDPHPLDVPLGNIPAKLGLSILWRRLAGNDPFFGVDEYARDCIEGRERWIPPGPSRWI